MGQELVGAAARYTRKTAETTAKPGTLRGQQSAAWAAYKSMPEVRFAANWIGNAMSNARLYAAKRGPLGVTEPAPEGHLATELVDAIAGGPGGQGDFLRSLGIHLVVAGEGWVVVQPHEDKAEDWYALSALEVSSSGRGLTVEIAGEPVDIPAEDDDQEPGAGRAPGSQRPGGESAGELTPVAFRVWTPSPARFLEPDSPVLGSLDQLEELRLLSASVKSIARSRLTGRGVLLVPQGTRFPVKAGAEEEDDLIDVFMDVAATAIREPESAAATVPILLEVPPEAIGQIQLLTFESPFDELAIRLREETIRRFANGLDIPAEILLGLGDTNHWSAFQLSSEAIKLGVEPRLGVITQALTNSWLTPLLEAEGDPEADLWVVEADTSLIRARTNRAETALQVYDRGAISAAALRRETGFDDTDAPDADEEQQDPNDQDDQDQSEEETDMPQDTDLPVDETQDVPDTLPASGHTVLSTAFLAAVDGLIWHALAHAGDKLLRTPLCPRAKRAEARQQAPAERYQTLPVSRADVEAWDLLDGALDRAPQIARRYGADPSCLASSLEEFLSGLIAAGIPYREQDVPAAVAHCLAA
ncbi:hypothetical protein [Streptomyces chilikensis]|uniref:Portal protein n=1 Tax=Streptomyces chilikensis TaxID=1194079 RepID=A0ABV3EJB7_9ACTN